MVWLSSWCVASCETPADQTKLLYVSLLCFLVAAKSSTDRCGRNLSVLFGVTRTRRRCIRRCLNVSSSVRSCQVTWPRRRRRPNSRIRPIKNRIGNTVWLLLQNFLPPPFWWLCLGWISVSWFFPWFSYRLGDKWPGFLQAGGSSCLPDSRVTLKRTQASEDRSLASSTLDLPSHWFTLVLARCILALQHQCTAEFLA